MKHEWPTRLVLLLPAMFMIMFNGLPYVSAGNATEKPLLMATTTSTENTGLLEYLMPAFIENTGIDIRWISTGTGKALRLGENCDVDVLLVHEPQSEMIFITEGFGTERQQIMYNDFVLIGPPEDPANIKGKRVFEALQAIRSSSSIFVSRGDNSGTNKKEISLWRLVDTNIPEKDSWYKQTGQGMLATINVTAELKGYTLTDRGTYIKYESVAGSRAELIILVEEDDVLLNQYSIIPVNLKHCPDVKHGKAHALTTWMAGYEAQHLIGEFKLLGKQLFTPNANRE
jgi:tungstate transport system substrate-binding protein